MENLQVYEFETATLQLNKNYSKQTETLTLNIEKKQAECFVIDLGVNVPLEMISIPKGTFMMGSPPEEEGRDEDETPQHEVNLSSFFMSKYLITQAQYLAVMGKNPSTFKGKTKPVETVSWYEACEFCHLLSQATQKQFRLPSEAEWEYACRAETTTPFFYGETLTTDLANYQGKFAYGKGGTGIYRHQTTEVGSFPPNGFGLYDLHGNVWEWCADTWHDSYENSPNDGGIWEEEETSTEKLPRVIRGGSWDDTSYYCRSAVRLWISPIVKGKLIGFRVVCK